MPAADPNLVVSLKDLKHSYSDGDTKKQVLHGIDLEVRQGTNIYLTGESGSGKTTLISLIGCLRSVQEGSLELFGVELFNAPESQLLQMRRRVGYVFQHFNLLDFMTIRQNVQQTLELQPDFHPRKAKIQAEEMLERVGLGDRVNDFPRNLSGGQKQRVAIARALAHRPKLVVADEPTAALDSTTGREIVTLFQTLAKEQESAVIIVTHNTRILDAADDIIHMVDGYLGTAVNGVLTITFPTLSDDELTRIAEQTSQQTFRPGELIIQQGDYAEAFFILVRGAVDVVQDDLDGTEQLLAHLSTRGDYFGEMGLLHNGKKRTASVRASSGKDTEVLVINRDVFKKMVDDSRRTRAVIKDEMLRRIFESSDEDFE